MKKIAKQQPEYMCWECGTKYKAGRWRELSTWHHGECGCCGRKEIPVTEPRDVGFLQPSWLKEKEKWQTK